MAEPTASPPTRSFQFRCGGSRNERSAPGAYLINTYREVRDLESKGRVAS